MSGSRKRICTLAILALLVAPSLSGCASGGEPTLASAVAHSGVVDGAVASLKAADDEREVQRMSAEAPRSPGEQEEVRDQNEQFAMEREQTASGDAYEPTGE